MTQRALLERMLRDAGPAGVSVRDLVYQHGITRAAAIVLTLRDQGWVIETRQGPPLPDGRQRLASYVLVSAPGYTARQPVEDGPGRPQAQPVASAPTLPPAAPLTLPCGCVRAANGMSWASRCRLHDALLDMQARKTVDNLPQNGY